MVSKKYAGIGSRQIPPNISTLMTEIGSFAAQQGYVLRSGGANGADSAFERGCDLVGGKKEICLPWSGFNKRWETYSTSPSYQADTLAATIHPTYNRLSVPAKKLIGRNMHQILGINLDDPVEFVLCWTPDGCESIWEYSRKTGGTGSAISVAFQNLIPVYNLFHVYHDPFVLFT